MSKTIIVTPQLVTAFRTFIIEGALPEHCWIWTGHLGTKGYAKLSFQGQSFWAARVSYAIYNGALSEHLEILHSCDNKICVSPVHLSQGTSQDNSNDCVAKNRQARGERNGLSKLRESDIPTIRFKAALGMRPAAIARDFNVSRKAIRDVLSGETWRNVP